MKITAKLRLVRPATCPTTIAELVAMLEAGSFTFPGALPSFGAAEPDENFRDAPWIKTDGNRNPLGVYTYSASLGKWTRDWGVPAGALMTVYRSSITIQADRIDKGTVDGWELVDGSGISGLDLRTNLAFFQGTSPEYDVYTLMFIGYGDG